MNQMDFVEKEPDASNQSEDMETIIEGSRNTSQLDGRQEIPQDLESYIRDSVFGSQIRDYNKRFRALDREMERLHRHIEERLDDLDSRLSQKIEELNADRERGLKEVERQLSERIEKGEVELRTISASIDSITPGFQEQIDKIRSDYPVQIGELREQMRRNYDTLRNELIAEADTLDESKMDRINLADSMIALGMKLKDENLLKQLNAQTDD